MSFVPLRRKLTVGGEGRLRGEVGSRAWKSMKGAKAWNRKNMPTLLPVKNTAALVGFCVHS